ncbi:hypothetical protein AMATHDRAFT_51205 [Amanita thiersii Skay4041]|uniref:FAD-binding FR-type domain-containing protein n=1 Tax=Amanita thiersii Skay4041 TaxID=703135 RepID=A0A2A9NF01_9AGAR|nr:hypothetical protein AMATHDRAFT_51205 [Amanita thiersii Skay4041]
MADTGTPPVIPEEFQQYNSYAEDPKWQTKFSIIWASVVGAFVVAALPRIIRNLRNGTLFTGVFGINENFNAYGRVSGSGKANRRSQKSRSARRPGIITKILNTLGSITYWSPPGIELNAGQIFIVCSYLAITVVCIVCNAPLISNPNRAGFLAVAQLPPLFLFATKNSILSLLLGPGVGYEKLNFVHRWAGRCLFLGGVIHGSLWIRNHREYGLPIIGMQKETSGVACLGLLCILVATSLRPVRRFAWKFFWIVHFLGFIAFFITLCYHTTYARPWVYAPLALYGLDLLMRMIKIRIKDAVLIPMDKQMTLIHIPYTTSGWIAGQHVRLRVFFQGRIFESHPLTIMSAPPSEGCLACPLESTKEKCGESEEYEISKTSYEGSGLLLGARAVGRWTKALNNFARHEGQRLQALHRNKGKACDEDPNVPVHVMVDGPYGGCSIDPSSYATVLLVSGGSGATFSIGLLDSLVGKCMRDNGNILTRKIEFVWFVRSYAAIQWFAPILQTIATHATSCPGLDFHLTVYVTCLCVPERVPEIPNCDVLLARPGVTEVLKRVVDGTPDPAREGECELVVNPHGGKQMKEGGKIVTTPETSEEEIVGAAPGGGLAVCASGPERLTREAANAVARLCASGKGVQLGRIGLHTELYAV